MENAVVATFFNHLFVDVVSSFTTEVHIFAISLRYFWARSWAELWICCLTLWAPSTVTITNEAARKSLQHTITHGHKKHFYLCARARARVCVCVCVCVCMCARACVRARLSFSTFRSALKRARSFKHKEMVQSRDCDLSMEFPPADDEAKGQEGLRSPGFSVTSHKHWQEKSVNARLSLSSLWSDRGSRKTVQCGSTPALKNNNNSNNNNSKIK